MKSRERAFLVSFLAIFILVTGLITVRRSLKGSNDFDTFYQAGQSVLKGEGIYYSGDYYQENPEASPFLYLPFAAVAFALFAILPLPVAAFVWNAASIGLMILAVILSLSILQMPPKDLVHWKGVDKLLFTALSAAILLDNLSMAQVNILVFTLTLLSLYCWTSRKNYWAGFWLACAVFIKLTPLLFILFFLLKKQWKVIAGFLGAVVLLTLILPSFVFGLEKNRIFHQQWAGRMIKPQLINTVSSFKNEPPHPDKKTAAVLEKERRSVLLLDKNQSLPAALNRLFLKDRVRYGYEPEPIYSARRYEKMPVLIPIPERLLMGIVTAAQFLVMIALVFATLRAENPIQAIPMFFLAMTLLSPLARSHQYISWVFVYLGFLHFKALALILGMVRMATVLYFLQALPYGKAVGLGTWANLTLFIAALFLIVLSGKRARSVIHEPAPSL